MKQMLIVAAMALPFLGCQSAAGGWNVSREILELAQETKLGGIVVIESDANGKVLNADCVIDTARLPKAVVAAAEKELPGPIDYAEREVAMDQKYWEVVKKVDGRDVALVFDDAGKLVGKEEELPTSKWPSPAVAAANGAVPGGKVVMVEFVWGPEALGGREWHVKKDIDGEVVRISVLEKDLQVTRVLRKIRAEFKAPK